LMLGGLILFCKGGFHCIRWFLEAAFLAAGTTITLIPTSTLLLYCSINQLIFVFSNVKVSTAKLTNLIANGPNSLQRR